jgi:hypothetical protein
LLASFFFHPASSSCASGSVYPTLLSRGVYKWVQQASLNRLHLMTDLAYRVSRHSVYDHRTTSTRHQSMSKVQVRQP